MRNNRSTHPEIETLSAYLDHQLTEAEEQLLLNRLSQDKALQAELDGLRQARYVLRQTPKVKRPRSFALTPEMVKQQSFAFRMMNVSRMVSAVASILLIVAIGSQYLARGGGFAASEVGENLAFQADEAAESDLAEEPMAMEAPVEDMDDAPEQAVEEAPLAEPVAEMEEAAAEEPAAEEPAAAADLAPQATPTLAGTPPAGGGGGETPGMGGGLPTDEGDGEIQGIGGGPTLTPDPGTARSIPSEKTPGDAAELEIPPAELADTSDEGMAETEPTNEEPISQPISPLRLLQAGLLVLALAAGITAVYFRKRVR